MTLPSAPLYNKVPIGYIKQSKSYDTCPLCGGMKHKQAKKCQNCRDRIRGFVPEIDQPDDPSYRFIPLSKGQVATVDIEDYEYLKRYKWTASWNSNTKSYYAGRASLRGEGDRLWISMHRVILGLEVDDDREGDHALRNTLDNRKICEGKENLRIANYSENRSNRIKASYNTSGYKGVSFDKRRGKWYAQITAKRKHIFLGYFPTKELAYTAYCEAAKTHHGKFARLE